MEEACCKVNEIEASINWIYTMLSHLGLPLEDVSELKPELPDQSDRPASYAHSELVMLLAFYAPALNPIASHLKSAQETSGKLLFKGLMATSAPFNDRKKIWEEIQGERASLCEIVKQANKDLAQEARKIIK